MGRRIAWLTACLLLHSNSAWAHSGHGAGNPHGAAHYLLEPVHALPLLLGALALAGVWVGFRRRKQAIPLRKRNPDD